MSAITKIFAVMVAADSNRTGSSSGSHRYS